MIKIALNALALLTVFSVSKAQTIPNSSFEDWTNMGSYSNPSGWATMNSTTNASSIFTATKGTPGNTGTAYLKLTSKTIGSSVVNGMAVSGKIDSLTMEPKSGFPFTKRPTSLTGKWQHMIYGTSQGSIEVILTRWDSTMKIRMTVGSGKITLSGMAMSWANFSIPINYTESSNPDSCMIFMQASGATPTNLDYLWVDNLAFTGLTTGFLNNKNLITNLGIYPIPSQDKLMISLSLNENRNVKMEVIDLNGKTILTKNINLQTGYLVQELNISTLSNGSYLLKVSTNNSTDTKKFIINK